MPLVHKHILLMILTLPPPRIDQGENQKFISNYRLTLKRTYPTPIFSIREKIKLKNIYPPVVAVAGWPVASFLLISAKTASVSLSSKAKYTGYCNRK